MPEKNYIYIAIIPIFGFNKVLTYKYYKKPNESINLGDIAEIEIRNRKTWGIIQNITIKDSLYDIKTITKIISLSDEYRSFIKHISDHHILSENLFYKKIAILLRASAQKDNSNSSAEIFYENTISKNINLNCEQKIALHQINNLIEQKNIKFKPIVLHGITGSGKTIIYISLIKKIYLENKSIIYILPDITLAESIKNELKKYLDNLPILSYHACTKKEDKRIVWEKIIKNEPLILIGVHIPPFMPIKNIGLYIIDEEHDSGFQEKNFPFINSKDALLLRSYIENVPIILGSATPSIFSLYMTKIDRYNLISLQNRYYNLPLPKIKHIVVNKNETYEKYYWLSKELYNEIEKTLSEKKQILLFLNRKGLFCFAQCNLCQFIFMCPNCSIWLTIHENNLLKCHRCLHKETFKPACPKCKSEKQCIESRGLGISQVRQTLEKIFPNAILEQADLDSLKNKNLWQEKIKKINNNEVDIIIGTKLLARGYHFKNVKTVGLIWADMQLGIPHFMSCETTLQNIIQVSGRAGRESENGSVIIQTFSENNLFNFLEETSYKNNFYEYEIEFRREFLYPPFIKLGLIIIKSINKDILEKQADNLFKEIIEKINNEKLNESFIAYNPINAPIYKIKNIYSKYIYIKSKSYSDIKKVLKEILFNFIKNKNIKIYYIPNPINGIYE